MQKNMHIKMLAESVQALVNCMFSILFIRQDEYFLVLTNIYIMNHLLKNQDILNYIDWWKW